MAEYDTEQRPGSERPTPIGDVTGLRYAATYWIERSMGQKLEDRSFRAGVERGIAQYLDTEPRVPFNRPQVRVDMAGNTATVITQIARGEINEENIDSIQRAVDEAAEQEMSADRDRAKRTFDRPSWYIDCKYAQDK